MFERNVDLDTGRPVVTRFAVGKPGPQNQGDCDTPSPGALPVEIVDGATPIPLPFDHPKNYQSMSARGIGTELPCLKAGGAAGFQAENDFGGAQNALEHHSANQQLFASLCSATIGSSAIDPRSCPLALLGGANFLPRAIADVPLSEFFSIMLSGERGMMRGREARLTDIAVMDAPPEGVFTDPAWTAPEPEKAGKSDPVDGSTTAAPDRR